MKSLKWKIISMLAVIVLISLTLSGGIIIARQISMELSEMQEEDSFLCERLVTTLQNADYETTQVDDFFSQLIAAWMLQNSASGASSRTFFLLDARGNTLYGRSEELTEREKASRTITDALTGKTSEKIHFSTDSEGESIAEYAQVFRIEDETYIVLVRQTVSRFRERVYTSVRDILLAIAIGMCVAAVIGFFSAERITQPLNNLSKKTKRLAAGELEEEIVVSEESEDELDRLGSNFNNMARALSEMFGALNREKDKLNIIFRYMTDGLLLYDDQGKLLEYNPAADALLGSLSANREFDALFPELSLPEVIDENPGMTALLETDQGYLNAVFAPFYNENESSHALLVVLQDITERRRVEEMQKEFVGNVSHELRTPITTMKSYVETVMDNPEMDIETRNRFLGVVDKEADRMASLVTDLLELSRMDAGRTAAPADEVDLWGILKEASNRLELTAAKNGLTICLEGYEDQAEPIYVRGNSRQLSQVFRNLIANAISYGGENNQIEVGVVRKEGTQTVSAYVRDHGIGIEEKDQKRIFERFYRVDKARSRSLGGTGLGLAIVKEIVDLHRGEITLDSCPGKGSTFTVTLPVYEEGADEC